jgi:hypothetical protein
LLPGAEEPAISCGFEQTGFTHGREKDGSSLSRSPNSGAMLAFAPNHHRQARAEKKPELIGR